MKAIEFYKLIYGDQEGYISINTIDQSMPKGTPGSITERFVQWPSGVDFADRYTRIRSDEDVYASVAVFSSKERTGRDAKATARVVWADADSCNPSNFRVEPSLVVQTSEGRTHCWWVLSESHLASECSAVSKAISRAHSDQGCDSGYQVSKLLRVPGTTNNKLEPVEVEVISDTGVVYDIADLKSAYGEVIGAKSTAGGDVPDELDQTELLALQADIPPDLIDLYTTIPGEGQSWSQRAYRLEIDLLRCGFSPEETYALMMDAACNKYRPEAAGQLTQQGVAIPLRSNPEEVTWAEVQKAVAALEAERLVEEVKSVSSNGTEAVRPTFVTKEEREFLRQHKHEDVVEMYVEMALNASPDSSETFHRSLAYELLACVFGDLVKVDLSYMTKAFGNQWTILLGASSLSRKSTAANFFSEVLEAVDKERWGDENRTYIGSDVTAEGLIKRLSERPSMSSLVQIDEVHGFLSEITGKKWRTGTKELLTKIYDGTVPGVIRSGQNGSTPSVPASLNLVGLGVHRQVVDTITTDDFESGFLLRTVWAVDDARQYHKGDLGVYFSQNNPGRRSLTDVKDNQRDFASFLAQCYTAAAGSVTVCYLDKEAEERFNDWVDRLYKWLKGYELEFLVPATSRMSMTVLRAASTRAVLEGTGGVVSMVQLLPVLQQSELWARDLVRVALDLTTTEWEKELDAIVGFMQDYQLKEPSVPDHVIARRFSQFRQKDLEDRLGSLRVQGRIRIARGEASKAARGTRSWEVLPGA